MSTEAIKITGLKETIGAMNRLSTEAAVEIRVINIDAAETIARDAAVRAPRLLGILADSIIASSSQKGYAAYVSVGKGLLYAQPVHWGWPRRGIAPQPFLYEALDARREEVTAKYEAGIKKLADRFGVKS